jgi:hypothetical protein
VEQGSGGAGVVFIGVNEWIVWLLIAAVLVLLVIGGWKLVKLLLAMVSG